MKKRNKPMPLDYEITEQPITALGGLPVLISAANALGLDELFDENLDVKLRNRGYSESELAMAIILTLLAGGESLDDVDKIRMDEVVSGRDFPHSTTVGDFLRRFENEELFDALDRVQEVLNRSILEQINYSSLTLDIDATMIKAEGKKRQGTGRSYNGITGYQALAVFASEPGLLLAHDFRPANAHPGSGATELLRQAESMIPEETKLHMRSDSACYNKDVVIFCEDFEMTFTISADLTSPLLSLIESLPDEVWHTLNKSEEVAQASR